MMANQIGPDDHNTSDWFRTEYNARGILIISIYKEQPPFSRTGNTVNWRVRISDINQKKSY